MGEQAPNPGPPERLSALLRDRKELLLERWERRLLTEPGVSLLRAEVSALVDQLVDRLGRGAGHPSDRIGKEPPACADPPAALAALSHLRAAILELCDAEGERLEGDAALLLHGALDAAMTAAAAGAQAAAERERERFEQILRALPVGLFVADAVGRILLINDAALHIWGSEAPHAESAAHYGVYRAYRAGTSEPLAAEEWGLARALQGEITHDEDVEIVSYRGERRTIVNSTLALRDAGGVIIGGLAVNVDVTDRKRTELRLAAIIEGALDAIVLIDASGRITEFNPAAERIFGYARGEAIGRELAELIMEPGLREAHRRGLQHYLATGESRLIDRRVEMRAMRADGSILDTELTVIRLPTGTPALFAGFMRDITDRKRAELDRRREDEFRERFIGMLGHDLRTPLGAVSFTAQILLRREGLDDALARGLGRIVKSADRMERMIGDLLDFARSRQGTGFPVTPAPADLAILCRQVLDEVKLLHPGRAVELLGCRSARGRWDPDRIGQVVQNLVVNALDYSPPDTRVEVTLDDAGDRIVLAVKNEGPPIPQELLGQLFDPFRRGAGDAARSGARRGLGLGLYIAHAIVHAHGGRVCVESDEARGTTFTVELPRLVETA